MNFSKPMPSISDSLLEGDKEKGRSSVVKMPLFISLFVIVLALFIGEMLFGKNSLEVLLALKQDETRLHKKIYHLKNQNASLQKKYFELKNIMPEEDNE